MSTENKGNLITFPSSVEIHEWWKTQTFQKEQGEQEYTLIYEIDLPKILKAFIDRFSQPIPTTPTSVTTTHALLQILEERAEGKIVHIHLDQPTPTKEGNVTAVEWLVDELLGGKLLMPSLIEEAIAMEKKQIVNAYEEGGKQIMGVEIYSEQYYNETYGGEK